MRSDRRLTALVAVLGGLVMMGAVGCASMNGAVLGTNACGVEGDANSTTRGAILGAAVGGEAGTFIGNRMDERAREIARTVPSATVERVGEGIRVTFPSGYLFDFDSDVVRSDAADNMDALARQLSTYNDTNMMIAGHTDEIGTLEYNQDLSERRARSAARYLAGAGVAHHIAIAGLGEREPVETNSTEAGRHQNRRVEIAIYASDALQEEARREASRR